MRRARQQPIPPYGGQAYQLIASPQHGCYWRSAQGLEVRLAAGEHEREGERRVAIRHGARNARVRVAPAVLAFFAAVLAR